MKIISKIYMLFAICTMVLISCKKTKDIIMPGDTVSTTMAPVTNLTVVPTTDENELEVSWTNPNDEALMKVSVSYAPTSGGVGNTPNPVIVNATKGANQKVSVIVPATVKYVVTVVAINKAGARSTSVSAQPRLTRQPQLMLHLYF
jgi:phage-related baseplate assembly protein